MQKKLYLCADISDIAIRNKVIIWMSQFARGIKKILSYAHTGIKEWQKIEIRDKYKQLALKI